MTEWHTYTIKSVFTVYIILNAYCVLYTYYVWIYALCVNITYAYSVLC